ncbi:MAG TPA: hypothetical protein VGC74_02835 [Stenotrophomonas sp.]|jgi:hypothetical protein
MNPSHQARSAPDRRQAEAVADALLAEGRARQRAVLLRRWRFRQFRYGQWRAMAVALVTGLALWMLGKATGVVVGRGVLWGVGLLVYALAHRHFRPRVPARGVIES